jgi:transcription factor SFP1
MGIFSNWLRSESSTKAAVTSKPSNTAQRSETVGSDSSPGSSCRCSSSGSIDVADEGLESPSSSSASSLQPTTPQHHFDYFTMPTTSPIDIAPPTRNASSSPSSQGKKAANYHNTDTRTSAMMSGTGFDSSMGQGRQDSFAGAKPISMNNPNRNADGRPRRESLAGSLVGGMSWGGVSVGSWIRDE